MEPNGGLGSCYLLGRPHLEWTTARMVLLALPAAAGWGGAEPDGCAHVVGTGEVSDGGNAEGSGDAEPGGCARATGSGCHTGATPHTQFLPALPPQAAVAAPVPPVSLVAPPPNESGLAVPALPPLAYIQVVQAYKC
jgi:hypothetical protein